MREGGSVDAAATRLYRYVTAQKHAQNAHQITKTCSNSPKISSAARHSSTTNLPQLTPLPQHLTTQPNSGAIEANTLPQRKEIITHPFPHPISTTLNSSFTLSPSCSSMTGCSCHPNRSPHIQCCRCKRADSRKPRPSMYASSVDVEVKVEVEAEAEVEVEGVSAMARGRSKEGEIRGRTRDGFLCVGRCLCVKRA